MTARVQVIVPYWGDPAYLFAAVDSVQAQSNPNWRLIVVDDAYPDPLVGDVLRADPDPRISYLRNEVNLGVAANFERCRLLADEEFVVFLGADDLLGSDYVQRVIDDFDRFPEAAIVQVGVRVIDGAGRPVRPLGDRVKAAVAPRVRAVTEFSGENLAITMLLGNWLYWPSLAFRTERLARYAFRQDYDIDLDSALVLEMVCAGERLVVDPYVCFDYRRHAASASSAAIHDGSRLAEDRQYYADMAELMAGRGWRRAARTARLRPTSRLHALTLLPAAARARDAGAAAELLRHTLSSSRTEKSGPARGA